MFLGNAFNGSATAHSIARVGQREQPEERRLAQIRAYEIETLSAEFDLMERDAAWLATRRHDGPAAAEISGRAALRLILVAATRLIERVTARQRWRVRSAMRLAKEQLYRGYAMVRPTLPGRFALRLLRPALAARRKSQAARRGHDADPLHAQRLRQPALDETSNTRQQKSQSRNLSDIGFHPGILTKRPTILIDVTPTAQSPAVKGGIPRVARGLAEAAVRTGLALPVHIRDGRLYSYFYHECLCDPIEPNREDIYVIVDVFWYFMAQYETALRLVRGKGAKVALFLHDIFPLQYPSFYPAEVPPTYRSGVLQLLRLSSFCLSSSKLGSSEVQDYLKAIAFPRLNRLRFGTFPLGFDPVIPEKADIRQSIVQLFKASNVFLSVGTLEPRKGYGVTLDACDLAWAAGEEFTLVIFGRYGWRAKSLQERILAHAQRNRRLFWFSDANDAELAYAFSHCLSLVQSSIAEGFGLPVLEALAHGAAVIATDLEVFKEIAGSGVCYYEVGNADDLARKLRQCIAVPNRVAALQVNSWRDSVTALAASLSMAPQPIRRANAAREIAACSPASPLLPATNAACCFDDKMAIQASVVAASVAHATTDAQVNFYMLHPPGISISIDALKAKLDSARFTIVDCVIDRDFGHLHRTEQFSAAIYYRLLLPEIVAGSRVIYLDSDILVRKSLLELYATELEGTPLAAAVDYALTYHLRDHGMPIIYKGKPVALDDYYRDLLDFDLTNTDYFNTGVLVMDLDAWRRTALAERCLAFLQTAGELNMADQDAANHILQGNFRRIDPRWNSFSYLHREYHPRPNEGLMEIFGGFDKNLRKPEGAWEAILTAWELDPWIVHFSHRSKPWEAADRRTAYDAEYWENARRTPYEQELRRIFQRSKPVR